jgi:hypothetical protein
MPGDRSGVASPRDEVAGFVNSRGYQKTPFVKIDWGERLQDYELQETAGLEPRAKRQVAAGRRAQRLPSADSSKSGRAKWLGRAGERQTQFAGGEVDAISFLDPGIELTLPGLKPDENQLLKTRVLSRIDAQVVEIQQRMLRRQEKMVCWHPARVLAFLNGSCSVCAAGPARVPVEGPQRGSGACNAEVGDPKAREGGGDQDGGVATDPAGAGPGRTAGGALRKPGG